MGVALARTLLGGIGALMMLGGITLVAIPGPGSDLVSALTLFVPGALLLAAVLLERTRYRSLHAELTGEGHGRGGGETARPDSRFRPTEERFVDPTTGAPMRVWVDPTTGDQRYVAEG